MTTEEEFRAMLDANPDDHTTRLVFADWLQERGDPRAEGYRALGTLRKHPRWFPEAPAQWYCLNRIKPWTDEGGSDRTSLPADWFDECKDGKPVADARWGHYLWHYPTKREAEDSAATAFANLPPERRAELLAGPPEEKK